MPDEEDKTLKDAEMKPFAEGSASGAPPNLNLPANGLTKVPGLQKHETGHVSGPTQNPTDPVAAGIDTENIPLSRREASEDSAIRTGTAVSGPHLHPGDKGLIYPGDEGLENGAAPAAAPAADPVAEGEHKPASEA